MKYDILIAGVGGQGTVLASRLIAAAAINQGTFVRTAETIGMAQRGGCVVSHVRIGSKEKSSMIPPGAANLLIGFEPAEALRHTPRLAPGAKLVINTRPITPVTASLLGAPYAANDILSVLGQYENAVLTDAYGLALQAGSVKALNVVLLGVAAAHGFLPFSYACLTDAIAQNVPQKFKELNLAALALGYQSK